MRTLTTQIFTKLVLILSLFVLLFNINLSWADTQGNRDVGVLVGIPFQTHYPIGTRGGSCKNMTEYFNEKVAKKWQKNDAVKADQIELKLMSCKEVKNTFTVGSPFEKQLEIQVSLEGLCPRPIITFKSKNFIDYSTVDTQEVNAPFLKKVGITYEILKNKHIANWVFTNAMYITVPGCDDRGNFLFSDKKHSAEVEK